MCYIAVELYFLPEHTVDAEAYSVQSFAGPYSVGSFVGAGPYSVELFVAVGLYSVESCGDVVAEPYSVEFAGPLSAETFDVVGPCFAYNVGETCSLAAQNSAA